MKNLKYIMATLMVALVVAVVCVACNKDKETPVQEANNNSENEPNTEVVERKPIATKDLETGKMTYRVTPEFMQEVLDHSSVVKEPGRFIIESFEITDGNSKGTGKENILFSMVDTETEKSYKTCLNKDFLEVVSNDDNVSYYIPEEVLSGNFSFVDVREDGFYEFTLTNFEVTNVEIIPDSVWYTAPRPKVTVTCESEGCRSGECIIMYNSSGTPYDCTDCPPPGKCHKTIINNGGGGGSHPAWVGDALAVIIFILTRVL